MFSIKKQPLFLKRLDVLIVQRTSEKKIDAITATIEEISSKLETILQQINFLRDPLNQ